jgi:asparagine synthase (glutamine-hydrolysing)
MCGIAGEWSTSGDTTRVRRMIEIVRHRGPDGVGYRSYERGPVFGHSRLRILDLSEVADQPLCGEDGSVWVNFNGEVYNYVELRAELETAGHTFRSTGDTEVLVHAYEEWGEAMLPRLNGMYAFALWDARRRQLLLVRDRFGVKPLYTARVRGGDLLFASEIKQLLAVAPELREPRLDRVAEFLTLGFLDHTEDTCFQDVRQILPAHYLRITEDGSSEHRYWSLESALDIDRWDRAPITEAAECLRHLLADAVSLQLRSDVPVGTCLSGGIDSSALVCLMTQRLGEGGVRTFTAEFDDPGIDEREHVKAVVEATRAKAVRVRLTEDDVLARLPALVAQLDEPFGSTSIVAQDAVMRAAREHGVTVLLDGQGADEAFCGYPRYRAAGIRSLLLKGRRTEADRLARPHRLGAYARAAAGAVPLAARNRLRRMLGQPRFSALSSDLAGLLTGSHSTHQTLDPLRRMQVRDFEGANITSLLHYEDRTSMAWSIEARVPYLDHRVVALGVSLGPTAKLEERDKLVLRRAVADLLPPTVAARRDKIGFATPLGRWMRGRLGDHCRAVLSDPLTRDRGWIRTDVALTALNRHQMGATDHGDLLWRWLSTELWARVHVD